MPKYKVGDHVQVKLSAGRIVEATIKAIRETTEGASFGEETALIAGTFTAPGFRSSR